MDQFVLVADDDPAMLKLVSAIVEAEGFIAATANNGKEAYSALKSGAEFVLAVVDVMMPYIEGTELVKFMQADDRFKHIPVIMMTGERSAKLTGDALAAGAIAFLPKPFTNSQLRTTMRTLVQK